MSHTSEIIIFQCVRKYTYNFQNVNIFIVLGAKRLAGNIKEMNGSSPNIFFIACWYFISPLFIFVSILQLNFMKQL